MSRLYGIFEFINLTAIKYSTTLRFRYPLENSKNLDNIPTIVYFVFIASLDCMDSHVCSHEISKKNPHYLSSLTHFGVGGVSGSDGGGGGRFNLN